MIGEKKIERTGERERGRERAGERERERGKETGSEKESGTRTLIGSHEYLRISFHEVILRRYLPIGIDLFYFF